MHFKTALNLLISCLAEFAEMLMPTTYCAHWSALMTESKCSRMKLEVDYSDLLGPCASVRYAKILLGKLNASISADRWSAIGKQAYAWEQSILRNKFSLPCVVDLLSVC